MVVEVVRLGPVVAVRPGLSVLSAVEVGVPPLRVGVMVVVEGMLAVEVGVPPLRVGVVVVVEGMLAVEVGVPPLRVGFIVVVRVINSESVLVCVEAAVGVNVGASDLECEGVGVKHKSVAAAYEVMMAVV
jgi:hypothetical protein